MNIYTLEIKSAGGYFQNHYYILAKSIAEANNLIADNPIYLDGTLSLFSRVPTTSVEILLSMYESVEPDNIPMIVLFIRDNDEYKNGNKSVFLRYPCIAERYNDLETEGCQIDYRAWVDDTMVIENK